MRNIARHLCRVTAMLLFLTGMMPVSGASESPATAERSQAAATAQQRYKVFCDHSSHGPSGYSTIYCYPNPRDAADVARAHNQHNPGHSARVVTCN